MKKNKKAVMSIVAIAIIGLATLIIYSCQKERKFKMYDDENSVSQRVVMAETSTTAVIYPCPCAGVPSGICPPFKNCAKKFSVAQLQEILQFRGHRVPGVDLIFLQIQLAKFVILVLAANFMFKLIMFRPANKTVLALRHVFFQKVSFVMVVVFLYNLFLRMERKQLI